MSGYLARMAEQEFEELILAYDKKTGLKAAIAIHNTSRGPALGGTRMWVYPNETAAVNDVMCLARGMSYKSAAAELPLGGGKGVIIGDPCKEKSEALFRAYGQVVERLNGRFITAADMGTGESDLDYVRMETDHVVGGSSIGSPSPFTAYGVWKGMKACVEEIYESPSLKDLAVAVQGIGTVGAALCKHLAEEGARLIVSDLDPIKAKQAADLWDAEVVEPDKAFDQQCDVFAPCGSGGVINEETINKLQCRIIAGAANNLLSEPGHGVLLRERGILYAPDYIINAGGIIFVEYRRQGNSDDTEILGHIAKIEGRLKEIFIRAREKQLPPEVIADQFAEEKLREYEK